MRGSGGHYRNAQIDHTRNAAANNLKRGGARTAAAVLEGKGLLELESHAEACRRAFIRRMSEVADRMDLILDAGPGSYGALLEVMRNEIDREIERLIAAGEYLPW